MLFFTILSFRGLNDIKMKIFGNFYRIDTYDYKAVEKAVREKFT